jgi:hypothetical protein
MNRRHLINAAVVWLAAALPAQATTLQCPPDSVRVGNTCVDTYEASLWQIDPANTTLVRKVQTGRVTLTDLTTGGALVYLFETPDGSILYQDTSGHWTGFFATCGRTSRSWRRRGAGTSTASPSREAWRSSSPDRSTSSARGE